MRRSPPRPACGRCARRHARSTWTRQPPRPPPPRRRTGRGAERPCFFRPRWRPNPLLDHLKECKCGEKLRRLYPLHSNFKFSIKKSIVVRYTFLQVYPRGILQSIEHICKLKCSTMNLRMKSSFVNYSNVLNFIEIISVNCSTTVAYLGYFQVIFIF